MLYDLAWAGIRYSIQSRTKPLANEETGRFDSLDQLFDKAAAAETIYPPKQPQPNQGKGSGNEIRMSIQARLRLQPRLSRIPVPTSPRIRDKTKMRIRVRTSRIRL